MPFWNVVSFIVGCNIGSFLNVCIWRMPRGISVVRPDSACPNCGHKIKWYENIPLLSWIFLLGKCSGCGQPISIRYFIIELVTGLLFSLIWLKVTHMHMPLYMIIPLWMAAAMALTTILIDAEFFIIPNQITYPVMIGGLLSALIFPTSFNTTSHLYAGLISGSGILLGGGGMALFAIAGKLVFKKDALGWGDVKFMAAAGACLGPLACFFIVFVGSLAGSVAGLAKIFFMRGRMKSAIPFGPYLAGALILWILFGEKILELYQNFQLWLNSLVR